MNLKVYESMAELGVTIGDLNEVRSFLKLLLLHLQYSLDEIIIFSEAFHILNLYITFLKCLHIIWFLSHRSPCIHFTLTSSCSFSQEWRIRRRLHLVVRHCLLSTSECLHTSGEVAFGVQSGIPVWGVWSRSTPTNEFFLDRRRRIVVASDWVYLV